MAKISVIIPTFNHRDYVCATLESALGQSFADTEIIVINDGSPDDTASVLGPLIESQKIHYIEQANAGQAAARNRGLALARGQYIAFLDDDDIWPTDKLEWQLRALEEDSSLGAIIGMAQRVDEQLNPLEPPRFWPDITFRSLFLGNPILSPGQTLIRSDLLRELGGFNRDVWGSDDWELWFRIAHRSRIQMRDRVALNYRVHARNASRDFPRMLANAKRVLELHLPTLEPAAAKALARPIRRWMYGYLGSAMMQQSRDALSHGQFRHAIQAASGVKQFVGPALCDPVLAALIARDTLPISLRRRLGNAYRHLRGR